MRSMQRKARYVVEADRLAVPGTGGPAGRTRSFAIPAGLTWVRGGEGSGKSTLLRLLAGVEAPSAGSVLRHAEAVYRFDPEQILTGADTARRWLQSEQAQQPDWDRQVEAELIDRFGLGEHLDKTREMLSSGSLRKFGLVPAFAGGAELVLLETPFAALDAQARKMLDDLLAQAADHPTHAWVVADYELPARLVSLRLAGLIDLDS